MANENENSVRIDALHDFMLEAVEELQAEQQRQQAQLSRFESRTAGVLCGFVFSLALASLFRHDISNGG